MALRKKLSDSAPPPVSLPGKGRLSIRFRNMNVLLFVISLCIIATVMSLVFNSVIINQSSEYAARYAVSTAEALSAHTTKEIGLMSKAAHSKAVSDWMADEDNETKKNAAFEEMAGIVGELYSFNLYVALNSSLNEYSIGVDKTAEHIAILDENRPIDAWYFGCIESDNDYSLSIDIDHIMQRKRVWLDYKVVQNGVPLGVICTGLEFSHIAGELFSHYESSMRGLIIDNNGVIHMDSALMSDKDFLYNNYEIPFEEEFPDPAFHSAIESYLSDLDDYYQVIDEPDVVKLSSGSYRYMTIAPIRYTEWSIVILSGPTILFDMSHFIPIAVTILALFIAFAIVTSAANYRLIFHPLSKLDHSLMLLTTNSEMKIFGTERDDELGHLSNTIQDLFRKANFDALTGIYNRRFMESNLVHIMDLLSRSNDLLSIMMLDIDHFKKYNDSLGHDQGDICLRSVAKALSGSVTRASDFAARYGGEEFIVVLPNTGESGARMIAERLLDSVRELNIPHPNNSAAACVTVSIGVTTGKISFTRKWEEYVKRADEALYMSKKNGRNQYTYLEFTES